jgi:hypothetical protein
MPGNGETGGGASFSSYLNPFSWCNTTAESQPEVEQEARFTEARRLVNSVAGDAFLSFSKDWKLIKVQYNGQEYDSTSDLPAAIQGWIGHVRQEMERNYEALSDDAGVRIAWNPRSVQQVMQELGFFVSGRPETLTMSRTA